MRFANRLGDSFSNHLEGQWAEKAREASTRDWKLPNHKRFMGELRVGSHGDVATSALIPGKTGVLLRLVERTVYLQYCNQVPLILEYQVGRGLG